MIWSSLEAFIKQVCTWGGYTGISGRILKNNSHNTIMGKVDSAIRKLQLTAPDLVGALESMTQIKGLGVSFATKHLRFLFPEYCPVLDSTLSCRLLYELSTNGYESFAAACKNIAGELNNANIVSTFPGKPSWRPSDVEAALYAWTNEWR
jgi:hypothetical protein